MDVDRLMPILCIESSWSVNKATSQSVWSVLDNISGIYQEPSLHLRCNTVEELTYNLRHIKYGFRHGILYFASHGDAGILNLGSGVDVTIEEIAEMMGRRFEAWHVHFGSCLTLSIHRPRLMEFKKKTHTRIVSGYTTSVDWIESTAADMLLMSLALRGRGGMWLSRQMKKIYPDLVRRTGLRIV